MDNDIYGKHLKEFPNNGQDDIYLRGLTNKLAPTRPFLNK